jgi:AcrR family transcriptional regulator
MTTTAQTPTPVFEPSLPLPRGPHKLTAVEVETSQRMRLMQAVAEIAGSDGYAAATVARLTARAGVSRATFYSLYADKEACLLAAYDHFVETLFERTAMRTSAIEDWDGFISAAIDAYLGTLDADPTSARAMVVEMGAAGSAARTRTRAAYRAFAGLLAARHTAMREADSSLGALPERAFLGIVLGIRDLVQEALETRPGEPVAELAPDIRTWLRATVLGAALA